MGLDTALNLLIPLKNKMVVKGFGGAPVEIDTVKLSILYFRKCYDIASDVADMLDGNATEINEQHWEFPLDIDYLNGIKDIIRSKYGDALAGCSFYSIWERSDYVNILGRNIVYTDMLIALALEHFDFEDLLNGCSEISDRQKERFIQAFENNNLDVDKIKCEFYNSY